MDTRLQVLLIVVFSVLLACQTDRSAVEYGNPPADGFNLEGSDEEAISIADEVMEAMGGRLAWDTTRFIKWTFFGRRDHTWDKHNGLANISVLSENLSITVDLNDKTGKVVKDGMEMTNTDSIDHYLDRGYKMWVNDSYWLVMPFKLKDSGVTLKYAGKDTTTLGATSDVLELTFSDVGVTPDNKYLVYVDEDTRLVTQWDYFANYVDETARFQSPWPDYRKYGDILLSGGQIAGNRLTNISISQSLTDNPFSN